MLEATLGLSPSRRWRGRSRTVLSSSLAALLLPFMTRCRKEKNKTGCSLLEGVGFPCSELSGARAFAAESRWEASSAAGLSLPTGLHSTSVYPRSAGWDESGCRGARCPQELALALPIFLQRIPWVLSMLQPCHARRRDHHAGQWQSSPTAPHLSTACGGSKDRPACKCSTARKARRKERKREGGSFPSRHSGASVVEGQCAVKSNPNFLSVYPCA